MSEFVRTLGGVYTSPGEAFRALAARPQWVAPLIVLIVVHLAFAAVWTGKMDARQAVRAQLEESGMMDRVPAEKQAEFLDTQTKVMKVMPWLGGLIFMPLISVILAAIFLFVFRFVFAGDLTFRQAVAVVLWSFLAVGLVSMPLTLAIMGMKGDWNIDPRTAIQASPAALLERSEVAKPLYTLASSLDLFSFWLVGLLSAGFAAAMKRPFSTGAWGVGGLWLVYVLGNVALSAIV
jgi:hypothetical protein